MLGTAVICCEERHEVEVCHVTTRGSVAGVPNEAAPCLGIEQQVLMIAIRTGVDQASCRCISHHRRSLSIGPDEIRVPFGFSVPQTAGSFSSLLTITVSDPVTFEMGTGVTPRSTTWLVSIAAAATPLPRH